MQDYNHVQFESGSLKTFEVMIQKQSSVKLAYDLGKFVVNFSIIVVLWVLYIYSLNHLKLQFPYIHIICDYGCHIHEQTGLIKYLHDPSIFPSKILSSL